MSLLLHCRLLFFPTSLLLLLFFFLPFSSSSPTSIQDLLKSKGLPAGLLPRDIKSYNLDDNGYLEVFLNGPCLTKFENRVFFESIIKANLSYGELKGVMGLSTEELFLWLPVKDIVIDDPSSGLIMFDVGVVHKQFSLGLFEDPPDCKQPDEAKGSIGVLKAGTGRKEKGFKFQR